MTFSLLAICPETGEAGYVQATSTPAVGDRVAGVVFGRGVVTVQAHGDYRLLALAKKLIEFGYSPAKVVKELADQDKYFEYRQVAVLDMYGNSAVSTGAKIDAWAGEVVGSDHVATGNVLAGEDVVSSMSRAFSESVGLEFSERLVRGLEAGRDAGGQPDGQTSASILVYGRHPFPILALRVDVHPEPVGHLRRIYDWYKVLAPYYLEHQLDPTAWSLIHWDVLEANGLPYYPDAGWTETDVENREAVVRRVLAEYRKG